MHFIYIYIYIYTPGRCFDLHVWHLVYVGFGGLIDGYSALCVVYEVSLEVVMTTRAWCAGDASIAIWRARLSAGQLDSGRLIKADVKAILGRKHMHSWIELSLYICITQRETYRILIWSILHNGLSVFAWQLSTKYHILLCKKVSYNHILIWYWLSDCIGSDRDPTWRRN